MAEFRIGQMLLASLVARKKQQYGDLLIGNGFNAPFVNKDINFAHGNMYLLKRKLGVFPWSGSTIFEALSMHRSDLVLAISDEAKEALSLYYHVNTKRIKVLHNCVDDKMFYPMYKQNATNVTVLFVGRLEETKGFKVILEFAKYIENKDNIKMKIATPSVKNIGYFRNLKNTTVEVGVRYDDMNKFYNNGDILLFPSKSEGFGLVTLESLCAGIPVACYKVGVGGELIAKRKRGVYLAEREISRLYQQLISVAREYKDMPRRIELYEQIREDYGMDRYIEKINKIINYASTKD